MGEYGKICNCWSLDTLATEIWIFTVFISGDMPSGMYWATKLLDRQCLLLIRASCFHALFAGELLKRPAPRLRHRETWWHCSRRAWTANCACGPRVPGVLAGSKNRPAPQLWRIQESQGTDVAPAFPTASLWDAMAHGQQRRAGTIKVVELGPKLAKKKVKAYMTMMPTWFSGVVRDGERPSMNTVMKKKKPRAGLRSSRWCPWRRRWTSIPGCCRHLTAGDLEHLLEGVDGVRLGQASSQTRVEVFQLEQGLRVEGDVQHESAHRRALDQVQRPYVALGKLPGQEAQQVKKLTNFQHKKYSYLKYIIK
jgi:hypothetical protein